MPAPYHTSRLVLPSPSVASIKDVSPLRIDTERKRRGQELEEQQMKDVADLRARLDELNHFVENYAQECKTSISQYVDAMRQQHDADYEALKARLEATLVRLAAGDTKSHELR